jgi:NitT/TauT family transport system substrate-binding protein
MHQDPRIRYTQSLSRRQVLKAMVAAWALAGSARALARSNTIRINIPGPLLMPFFPIELIPRLGIDRTLGFNLGIRYHPTGVLALEDMLAGNADFAGTGFPILPRYLQQGRKVVAIGRISSGAPPYAIIVRADLAERIRSIEDLRGHTLGVPIGSATTKTYLQLVAELWVSSHGVARDQLRWAPITQTYEGVYGAMAGQTVDAVFCEEPYSASLVREGLGRMLASLNDPLYPVGMVGREHLRAVIATTPARANAQPASMRAMTQMLNATLQWIHAATPAEMVEQLQIADADQRRDILDALTRLPLPYSPSGRFSGLELEATREFMQAVGIKLPDNTDIRDFIDDRWVGID